MQYTAQGSEVRPRRSASAKDRLGDHRGPPITVAPVAWTCSNACSGESVQPVQLALRPTARGFELEHTAVMLATRTGQELECRGRRGAGRRPCYGDAAAQKLLTVWITPLGVLGGPGG